MNPTKSNPQRTCVVSRQTYDKADLLRFVVGPDGKVWFDASGKLDARGAYVHPSNLYAKNMHKILGGKLKAEASVDLADTVENQLKSALLNSVGLAKRGGNIIISLEEVKPALENNSLKGVIVASDSGENPLNKLAKWQNKISRVITAKELSETLGVPNVVVIGFKSSPNITRLTSQLSAINCTEAK